LVIQAPSSWAALPAYVWLAPIGLALAVLLLVETAVIRAADRGEGSRRHAPQTADDSPRRGAAGRTRRPGAQA
jgi:hypothetical protein